MMGKVRLSFLKILHGRTHSLKLINNYEVPQIICMQKLVFFC